MIALGIFAVLALVGLLGGFAARIAIQTVTVFVARILLHAAIGFGIYLVAKMYVSRRKSIILGSLAAVGSYIVYISYYGIWLALPRG